MSKTLTGYFVTRPSETSNNPPMFLIREQAEEIAAKARQAGYSDARVLTIEIPFAPGVITEPPFDRATAEIQNGQIVGWSAPL